MKIALMAIDQIRAYEHNPRVNDQAVDAVVASIREFGFRQPIVVDSDRVIIVGHVRYKAAVKLGLAKVPVHVATDLSPDQIRSYRIADNKTNELADWDFELLPIELSQLRDADVDLALLGFDADELAKIMGGELQAGLTDPDDVPAPPDAAITQPGDLWILGEHRLLCGDSAKPQDLDRLLGGEAIHLVNMDPPYNVQVEPRSNNAIAAGLSSFQAKHHKKLDVVRDPTKAKGTTKQMRAKDRPLANDFVTDLEFDDLLNAWFGNAARVLMKGRGFYIWGGYANCANYPPFLKKHGLYFSQPIIWMKEHPVPTRKDYMGNHEWCFYGWKEGAGHQFFGPNNATDVWSVKKVSPQSMVHLTEKPVELATRAMQYSSRPGENVLDLFGGSGSTLIQRRAMYEHRPIATCDLKPGGLRPARRLVRAHAAMGLRRDVSVDHDPRRMRPSRLIRLLNSTPLGAVLDERRLYRHRMTAGARVGDARSIDLIRYAAWLFDRLPEPEPGPTAVDEPSVVDPRRPDPPVPPADLSPAARCVWDQVIPLLARLGIVTPLDGQQLERYCRLYVRWRRCEDKVVANPAAVIEARIAVRLDATLRSIEANFGMSPLDRMKLQLKEIG